MRLQFVILGMALGMTGCLGETTSQYQPTDPVRAMPAQHAIQATTEAATRVDSTGRMILARNPQIGVRPFFRTVGTPEAEIFHVATNEIVITQKLVEMCPTDGELAAILSLELAKMIAEREAMAARNGWKPPPMPPADPGLPRAVTFEEFRKAELARFQRETGIGPAGLPDPEELARTYLRGAGFPENSLDKVRTQLRTAEKNSALEAQMTGRPSGATPFQPPSPR